MKSTIIIFLITLYLTPVFSEDYKYDYRGRNTPTVKKECIKEAHFITEITPEFWRYLALSYKEQCQLNELLELRRILYYPEDNYNDFIDYVSFEIGATCNGNALAARSTSDKLTIEQKNILNSADMGSDIIIKIKFKYKNQVNENPSNDNNILEGELAVTLVPETEAEYPGGFNQMSAFFIENFFNKISETSNSEMIAQAVVKFTINEEGQVVNAKIFRSSSNTEIDKLILEATNKMPVWKPAKNLMGKRVKQEFTIPFVGGGC